MPPFTRPRSQPLNVAFKTGDVGLLARSFRRTLEAADQSPGTVRAYTIGVTQFATFLQTRGMPLRVANITREHVEAWLGAILRRQTPATARTYYGGLQAFFDWLVARGELEATPMARVKPRFVPERPPTMLSDAELRRLLGACQGASFEERRDLAMLRLMMDTGLRLSEATYLGVKDVDLNTRMVRVHGPLSRPRALPFGQKTTAALREYLGQRARHPHARSDGLWLGLQGPLDDDAVDLVIRRRARQAWLPGTPEHLFRHGFAHAWRSPGRPRTRPHSAGPQLAITRNAGPLWRITRG